MSFEPFAFTKSWTDPADFPTYEPDEGRVRADLQLLHDETRDALNRLIAGLNDPGAAARLPFRPADGLTARTVQEAVEQVHRKICDAAAGLLVDGTVTKEKLSPALLEMVYGGTAAVSLNTPGAAENPDSGQPLGRLWYRPGCTVRNHAAEQWEVAGCTMEQEENGWLLRTDATLAEVSAVQTLPAVGEAGKTVWVSLQAAGDLPAECVLLLNGVEFDLSEGGGIFETALDQTGSLELELLFRWDYPHLHQEILITDLAALEAVMDEAGTEPAAAKTDWEAFLTEHMPFTRLELPWTVWLQTAPGQWTAVEQQVLPVGRGGTGLTGLASGQLLIGSGDGGFQPLPAPEAAGFLAFDGSLGWKTADQTGQALGVGRVATGTYTGTAAARSLQLPVTPQLLVIFPENGLIVEYEDGQQGDVEAFSGNPVVLVQGAAAAVRCSGTRNGEGTAIISYLSQVSLAGSKLTMEAVGGDYTSSDTPQRPVVLANEAGAVYRWAALYGMEVTEQ